MFTPTKKARATPKLAPHHGPTTVRTNRVGIRTNTLHAVTVRKQVQQQASRISDQLNLTNSATRFPQPNTTRLL